MCILSHPSSLPFESRFCHPKLLANSPSWVPSAILISKLLLWLRPTSWWSGFSRPPLCPDSRYSERVPLCTLLSKRKASRPVRLQINYPLQTRLHVQNLNWLYFTSCISHERWKVLSGKCFLALVKFLFVLVWRLVDRCLIGMVTFWEPEQNPSFPTRQSLPWSAHLRKWWFHSSSGSGCKNLASSLTPFFCFPTPNSSQV